MAMAGSLSATPMALPGSFKNLQNYNVQQPNSYAHHVDRSGKGKLLRPESKRLLEGLEQQETLFSRNARIAKRTRMRDFRAAGLPHPTFDHKSRGMRSVIVKATIQEKDQEQKEKDPKPDVEETTRKLGLEAGLWQTRDGITKEEGHFYFAVPVNWTNMKIFASKDESKEGPKESRTSQAKALLARYGGAYLVTSISLSVISFGLCYVLVSNGVDVAALLQKVGIQSNETGEKVGTFALAYAAHKAASPIRFPPTVALTPIVAGWFGKKPADVTEEDKV